MVTVDTLLRLAGNLARAEKQYRECPVPQKARAWKIMEEAGDRIRDLIDGRRPAEQREAEQIPHPVAEAEQSPQPPGYALAMRVRQSTLYGYLDDVERGECDTLVKGWASKLAQAPTRNAGEAQP